MRPVVSYLMVGFGGSIIRGNVACSTTHVVRDMCSKGMGVALFGRDKGHNLDANLSCEAVAVRPSFWAR